MDSKNESIGRFINQFNCFQTTRLSSLVAVEILLGAIRETRILFARLNRKFHGINAFVSAPSAISKRRAALEKRCNNILVMRRDTKQRFIRVAYLTTRSLVGTRFHLDRGQNRCNEFIVTTQTRYRFFFTRVLLARFQIFLDRQCITITWNCVIWSYNFPEFRRNNRKTGKPRETLKIWVMLYVIEWRFRLFTIN